MHGGTRPRAPRARRPSMWEPFCQRPIMLSGHAKCGDEPRSGFDPSCSRRGRSVVSVPCRSVEVASAQEVLKLAGRELGPTSRLQVSQQGVDTFGRSAQDWHWARQTLTQRWPCPRVRCLPTRRRRPGAARAGLSLESQRSEVRGELRRVLAGSPKGPISAAAPARHQRVVANSCDRFGGTDQSSEILTTSPPPAHTVQMLT